MEQIFSQSELEALAAALAHTSDGLSGSEIGHILSLLRMKDPDPMMTKWKRLHNAFVERQNKSGNRRAVLEFIRQAMKPARYARQPARFEPLRMNVNRALASSGLAVDAAGTLYSVTLAQTLTEASRRINAAYAAGRPGDQHSGEAARLSAVHWDLAPVHEHLATIAPTHLESDVRAAALAEATFGAGRDFELFAYVSIVDHPYFAVTDKDGKYTIKNVPDGKYTMEILHRKAAPPTAPVTKEVEVKGGSVTADITLEAK